MVRSDGEDTDSRMYYRSTSLDEVFRRVKDIGDIRLRSSEELDEGYAPGFPIICGEGFRLYECDDDFVFDWRTSEGEWDHSHPQDVDEAVEWIKEYIEGTFR